jgi:hypothetical protein
MIPQVRRAICVWAVLWAGLALAGEPVLHVRARSRIDVQAIQRVPGGLLIRGTLVDVGLGEPIAGHTVAISVDGEHGFYRYAEPTGVDGRFRWKVPLPLGQYTLRLAAGGDEQYAQAEPIVRSVDVARRTPTVRLAAPNEISVREPQLYVTVEAEDPEGDIDAGLGLSVPEPGPARAVELPVTLELDGKAVARLRTRGGRVEHTIEVAKLGAPGALATLTVRYFGDELRNAAQASRTVRVTTPTYLTLRTSSTELPWKGAIDLEGELSDGTGPVASGRVTLVVPAEDGPGQELASVLTNEGGHFATRLEGGVLRPGTRFVEARHQPVVSFREPSRSPAIALELKPPQPRSVAFYISPLLFLIAFGLATLLRRRPWRLLVRRRAAVKEARAAHKGAGLTEGRPRLLSNLRAPHDFGLSGQVCELPAGDPLPTASVSVNAGDVDRMLAVDEEGRFLVEGLPPGPIVVEISAPGFVVERFERALPHRGELRGTKILLVPIRQKIFAAYQKVALPLFPDPALAGTWTPRELLDHVARRMLIVDELAALTSIVEEAYFGPRLPDGVVLAQTELLCRRVATVHKPTA